MADAAGLGCWNIGPCAAPGRALAEICQVPRAGGLLHLAEHGRSPDVPVTRWQDRLTPLQRRLDGGCHLNRPTSQLIADSGLQPTRSDTYYRQGPKSLGYTFEGRFFLHGVLVEPGDRA